MAETADRSAEEELARWLRGDATATRNAVRAVGRSGNRELTPHLVALLEDRKLGPTRRTRWATLAPRRLPERS